MQTTSTLPSSQPSSLIPPAWRYGLVYRPAGIGAVPPGFINLEEASGDVARQARHGIIVYDRALSDQEIRSFELLPLLDDGAVDRLVHSVTASLEQYARGYASMAEEDPACFRGHIHDAMTKAAGYRVYAGDLEAFCARVADRLRERLDAEIAA